MKSFPFFSFLAPFNSSVLRMLSCLGLVALLSACSPDQTTSLEEPKGVRFDHELSLSDGATLSDAEKQIASKIQAKEVISYDLITRAFEDLHWQNYQENKDASYERSSLEGFLKDLNQSINASEKSNPHRLKVAYEKTLNQRAAPVGYRYDSEATTLADIDVDTLSQCYSGTALFEVMYRRTHSVNTFLSKNRVVIFEPGHVLPGYVIDTGKGYRLYGVETTVGGKAVVDFGPTRAINQPIRVLDANDFLVIEIFE